MHDSNALYVFQEYNYLVNGGETVLGADVIKTGSPFQKNDVTRSNTANA